MSFALPDARSLLRPLLLLSLPLCAGPLLAQTADPLPGAAASAVAQPNAAPPVNTAASQPASPLPLAAPAPRQTVDSLLGAPQWQQLSEPQRQVLAPLAQDWNQLDPNSRSKWLEVAARFHRLSPEQQARVHERMAEWTRMTPAERLHARLAFQSTRQLSSQDLQAKWEAYQALTPEKRQALLDKASRKKPPTAASTPASPNKNNLVPKAQRSAAVAVAPTVLQARPGATTVLITQGLPELPAHQLPGAPKVLADPSLVNPKTLLPLPASTPHP